MLLDRKICWRAADKELVPEGYTDHLADSTLESYLLGTLSTVEVDRVDEHLLMCGECRTRMLEREEFISSVWAAVREGEGAGERRFQTFMLWQSGRAAGSRK